MENEKPKSKRGRPRKEDYEQLSKVITLRLSPSYLAGLEKVCLLDKTSPRKLLEEIIDQHLEYRIDLYPSFGESNEGEEEEDEYD